MPGARRYRIDIVTKASDVGILAPKDTGLTETIQAGGTTVTVEGQSTSHVVVRSATPPFLLESDDAAVRKLFPRAIVTLVHVDVAGAATVSCSAAGERERFSAAASVATLKRSWGWDESPTITITFADDGHALRLNPVVQDGVWWVDPPA